MPAVLDRQRASDRETGWVNRLFGKEGYTPEYQELKFTLHRKLLDRINLEALSSMAGERVRAEIRSAVAKLVDEEKTPLSLVEKDRVIEEILDEVFGLLELDWKKYVQVDPKYFRPAEVDLLLGDASKARKVLNWKPKITFKALAKMMTEHDLKMAKRERVMADHQATEKE